jgi:hypothetical protein
VLARPTTTSPATGSSRRPRAEAQEGGWFHTGDGGYLDDDGYLVISDRKKDVIITGGENVSSIEVEDALYSHPAWRGGGDRRARREVGRDWSPRWSSRRRDVTAEELIAHCRTRWPATSARSGSSSWSCRGPPPASCRSSSCASRSGRPRARRSTDAVAELDRVRAWSADTMMPVRQGDEEGTLAVPPVLNLGASYAFTALA